MKPNRTKKAIALVMVFVLAAAGLGAWFIRSRGSASPMLKRTSHITVVLDQK